MLMYPFTAEGPVESHPAKKTDASKTETLDANEKLKLEEWVSLLAALMVGFGIAWELSGSS